jgi:hypothetical protein
VIPRRTLPALGQLRPRPRLLPESLRLAPELAVLAVLDDALRSALVALLAVHHQLHQPDDFLEHATLRRARRLAQHALDLRDSLDAYRDAVLGTLDIPEDDIDF